MCNNAYVLCVCMCVCVYVCVINSKCCITVHTCCVHVCMCVYVCVCVYASATCVQEWQRFIYTMYILVHMHKGVHVEFPYNWFFILDIEPSLVTVHRYM